MIFIVLYLKKKEKKLSTLVITLVITCYRTPTTPMKSNLIDSNYDLFTFNYDLFTSKLTLTMTYLLPNMTY
jgi:hypothetical protein